VIRQTQTVATLVFLIGALVFPVRADDATTLADVVAQLRQQNQQLQEQLQRQNTAIEALNRKVTSLEEKSSSPSSGTEAQAGGFGGAISSKVRLSGEGAVGFFNTGSEGLFPNSEFRVDEARLFLDAAVWEDVFGFIELNLATTEGADLNAKLGEAYLDFESISKHWGHENLLSIRLGRLDVPFGEEYLYRDAIDNPLVSHSVMDFWGVDEGVEIYGAVGKVNYLLAVQNGGSSTTRDFNGDKSVVLRLAADPTKWLHVGASAMRTGNLGPDDWSEIWVGNGIFSPIGSTNVSQFHVNLAQGDVRVRLPHGHLHFAGGYARYDDNEPGGSNQRDFWFWSAEGVHNFTSKFYAGARFSQVWVKDGYPLPGQGDFGQYYFGDPTEELWRLSLGVGYRFSENLVLKTEYSFEHGRTLSGDSRNHEDMFSAVAAFKF
jgi:hypothetical protein